MKKHCDNNAWNGRNNEFFFHLWVINVKFEFNGITVGNKSGIERKTYSDICTDMEIWRKTRLKTHKLSVKNPLKWKSVFFGKFVYVYMKGKKMARNERKNSNFLGENGEKCMGFEYGICT